MAVRNQYPPYSLRPQFSVESIMATFPAVVCPARPAGVVGIVTSKARKSPVAIVMVSEGSVVRSADSTN